MSQHSSGKTHKSRNKSASHVSLSDGLLPFPVWLKTNRKLIIILSSVFSVLFLLLILLTNIYTGNLKKLIDSESYGYLEELSTQINSNLIKGLNFNYSSLETLGTKVVQNSDWTLEEIQRDLNNEDDRYTYIQIALIDDQGNWCIGRSSRSIAEMLPFVAEMTDTNRRVTSNILNIEGRDSVVMLSPIPETIIEGRTFIGIGAVADMTSLNDMLSLTLFDGQGYAHVVTSNGNIVMRSSNEHNQFQGYNILTYLQNSKLTGGITLEQIEQDFKTGRSRKIHYIADGTEYLSIYSPVGYQQWYLFTVIPADILNQKTQAFYFLTFWACIAITVLFLLLAAAVFVLQAKSRLTLLRQLYTDPITKGRSLAKFELDAKQVLRQIDTPYSIIYANVERFKRINDQAGREDANNLLQEIYAAMASDLESGEFASRIMADHFAILIMTRDLTKIRSRICQWNNHIADYSYQNNLQGLVELSYGVYALTGEDSSYDFESGTDINRLLDKANLARKTLPKITDVSPRIAVFDIKLEQKLRLEQELESRQEDALISGEFAMYLQPKYSPATNKIAGAEALVRWITKDRGILYPDQYIPLFESNGFIVKLDRFIFEEACRFLSRMAERGLPPIPISVNLSRVNLNNPEFLIDYLDIWAQYGIDAGLLEFEITETLIYDNIEHLRHVLDEVHRHGFMVSMDDFGSGYSSLNMLKDVNVDAVKLDREFFLETDRSPEKAASIVRHLIDLAKDLGMKVVAEGVEHKDQVDFLRTQGCEMIQGYYYSRPVPAEAVMQMLVLEKASE